MSKNDKQAVAEARQNAVAIVLALVSEKQVPLDKALSSIKDIEKAFRRLLKA